MLTASASENPVKVNPEPKLSAHHNACTAHMLTPSASENTKKVNPEPNATAHTKTNHGMGIQNNSKRKKVNNQLK
jgi:hypothetical protein